ncbi:MAG: hypothetical protein NTU61_02775 [Candidatus Altiarchaeota archaeon]|nr:hypothetical protein [Candidatus Altiarchaeota archaeon]
MKVLITLGPTQEPVDDVRFITNSSSGKMGVALAEDALRRGHEVILVCGPVNVETPKGAKVFKVRTAEEMTEKTLSLLNGVDVLISTAAIADYTPEKKVEGKIKSGGRLVLKLKPTRKLVKEARGKFPKLFIVGFKAESGLDGSELVESARRKLEESKLDLIIANDLQKGIFGSDDTEAFIIDERETKPVEKTTKKDAAKLIWDTLEDKLIS